MKKLYTTAIALACAGAAMAQNNVSTGTQKYVLLEEGTGTWCQYCPDGQVFMMNILNNTANQNKVVAVALHNGSSDAMALPDPNVVMAAYAPNWPNGAVDRVLHTTSGKVFTSRSNWQGMVTQQLAVTPDFQIDLSHDYNNTTKALSISVKVKTLNAQTGKYNINCYIVEDSVTGGNGYSQVNYYNTQAGHPYYQAGNPIVGFTHRHVARAMLSGPWGDSTIISPNPAVNSTFTKTYTYNLPTTANYNRYKIIAYIQKHDPLTVNNRIIKNSIEAHVKPGIATGITEINDNITDLVMYPNPASNNLYITGVLDGQTDVNISVINTVGQTVIEKNYKQLSNEFNTNLSLENLTSGIYFVTVSTKDTKRTERIVVNK